MVMKVSLDIKIGLDQRTIDALVAGLGKYMADNEQVFPPILKAKDFPIRTQKKARK